MFSVFRRHRKLKLLGLALGLLLVWFAAKPAADLINGQNADPASLVGNYANTSEHQIVIYDGKLGRMVSEDVSADFLYSFEDGILDCNAVDFSFQIRVLGNGNLWNCYDGTYLYRRIEY